MAVVEIHQDNAESDLIVVDRVHQKIHEGLHFSTSFYEKLAGGWINYHHIDNCSCYCNWAISFCCRIWN
jgi:hypothetical protein